MSLRPSYSSSPASLTESVTAENGSLLQVWEKFQDSPELAHIARWELVILQITTL